MLDELDDEVLVQISTLVRTGFYNKDQLLLIFLEEMYAPGDLDEAAAEAAIDAAIAEWTNEKKTWPTVTDCDRLEQAFAAMEKLGIIALQNAGNTQSEGYDDFRAIHAEHPKKSSVIGYCFYHGQDLERAVLGGGLYLAFGPADRNAEETEGLKVGNLVRAELERVGLQVEWDGTFATRLHVPNIDWLKH